MKILTISDKVEELLYSSKVVDRFGGVDLVLSCGDLPEYYLEYIVTMLNVPLYYVFGNHGPQPATPGQPIAGPGGCINIDNRVINVKGLLIAGFAGSMRYNRQANFQYSEWEMWEKVGRRVPRLLWNRLWHRRSIDILVTHAPPCGIHDGEDLCHRGFKAYLWLMDRFRPRYLIHGHTHVYLPNQPVCTVYGNTEVINSYGYRLLEVEVPPSSIHEARQHLDGVTRPVRGTGQSERNSMKQPRLGHLIPE
jgi:hypothetical protein